MLATVTTFYNPEKYENPLRNYRLFREGLTVPDEDLYTVELSFDGEWQIPGRNVYRLRGGPKNVMWQKERLINYAVERLPRRYDTVAWLDCDLLFDDADWPRQSMDRLKSNRAVQLFSEIEYTDHDLKPTFTNTSFSKNVAGGLLGKVVAPGGAWAMSRDLFPIPDRHVAGGGDGYLTYPMFGYHHDFFRDQMSNRMLDSYDANANKILKNISSRAGYLDGKVTHLFHGSRKNRQYADRTTYLQAGDFDPLRDVRVRRGLLEWATPKFGMHKRIADYFRDRDEDGIIEEAERVKEQEASCYFGSLPLMGVGF